MFVITADQRASRTSADLVPEVIATLTDLGGSNLAAAVERTVGDEVQTMTDDAATALAIVLALTREGSWSVGVGIGDVETPLPDSVRAGRGDAFVRARDAVERAKRSPTRLAVSGGEGDAAADAEALLRLLVELRDRRSREGWQVYDLLAAGASQREAATRIGVTDSAVSLRARAASLRTEEQALPALERLLLRAAR